MTPQYERLQKCYEIYKEKIHFEPRVALVLGSGLGDYADQIEYESCPGIQRDSWLPDIYRAGTQGALRFRLCGYSAGCDHAGPRALL